LPAIRPARIWTTTGSPCIKEVMAKIRNTRARRPRKAPAKPKGLRVQLKGRPSLKELRGMLVDVLERLDALGIKHASGINLYLTPVSKDGTPLTPLADGQPVTNIIIESYRSAADEHGV
jgi:hypothetical protein